jgi:hypothetical protein
MRGMRLHDPYVFEISIFKCSATFCKWSPPTCELLTHPKLEPFLQLPVFWATKYGQFVMHKTGVMPAALRHLEAGLTPPLTGKCSTQKGPVFPRLHERTVAPAQNHQDFKISLGLWRVSGHRIPSGWNSFGWNNNIFLVLPNPIWLVVDVSISSGLPLGENKRWNQSDHSDHWWKIPMEISPSLGAWISEYYPYLPCFDAMFWTFRTFQSGIRPIQASKNSGDHPNPGEMDVGQNGKPRGPQVLVQFSINHPIIGVPNFDPYPNERNHGGSWPRLPRPPGSTNGSCLSQLGKQNWRPGRSWSHQAWALDVRPLR